jgi:hypothetical protein
MGGSGGAETSAAMGPGCFSKVVRMRVLQWCLVSRLAVVLMRVLQWCLVPSLQ